MILPKLKDFTIITCDTLWGNSCFSGTLLIKSNSDTQNVHRIAALFNHIRGPKISPNDPTSIMLHMIVHRVGGVCCQSSRISVAELIMLQTSASCWSLRSCSSDLCLCIACSYSVLITVKSCFSLELSTRRSSFSASSLSSRSLNGPSTSEIIWLFRASTLSLAGI